jgi:type I restriction enzyme S subunit
MYSTSTLDSVCDIIMGQAPSGDSYNEEQIGLPLIAGAGDFSDRFPSPKKFTNSPTKRSQKGDIVVGIRASIGQKVWSDGEYCLGRGVAGLRAKDNIDSKYLWYWLDSVQQKLISRARGATFLQINRQDISSLIIPLPPLPEQRRIAQILDAADALRSKRRESIALLDDLLQSTFLDMFGDPVMNPKGWEEKRLSSIGTIMTGNTPSRKISEYYGSEIEWIKSDNINTPSYILTNANEGLSSKGMKVGRVAKCGSIMVTCIAGSPDCIGNSAIADRDVAFNQQINAFTPNNKDNLYYIFGVFLIGKKLIQLASTNSMKGMVNKTNFENISIPYPPYNLQRKFSELFGHIEKQRKHHQFHLTELDNLFNSLQQRAFNGEL